MLGEQEDGERIGNEGQNLHLISVEHSLFDKKTVNDPLQRWQLGDPVYERHSDGLERNHEGG